MAAAPAMFDGEYADKKFLNGQDVFEFSIHQTGGALEIAFDAAYSDGHGAAPDATGAGKVNGNTAEFTWKDSEGNTGTGTIASHQRRRCRLDESCPCGRSTLRRVLSRKHET